VEEELTEAEKELLDNLDQEHQDVLKKTDINWIFESQLRRAPAFSSEEILSIIEKSGIVEKIIAAYKKRSVKTDTVLLIKQAVDAGIPLQQEHIQHLAEFQVLVGEYIRAALTRRLYFQVPLVISEALSFALNEHKTTSEQQELERLISDSGRSPYLPLRDPRGRKAVITDESLLRAFQEKGSSATMVAVAEILEVTPGALKKWRQDDSRNFKSWKDVQQYFAQGEK
jgi:hypothetical protein